MRLILGLAVATLGGTVTLHFLKNYLLKEKIKLRLDWDGIIERSLIVFIILAAPQLGLLLPFIIIFRTIYRLILLGPSLSLFQTEEPGIVSQKVLLKAELAFDLLLSPAFAILIGVIFK